MDISGMKAPWLRFNIGDSGYAIPLQAVAEVMGATSLRLIPLVPLELGGILNVRGEPLPGVNGGVLLEGRPSRAHRHVLLLEQGNTRLGVLVGRVSRIERTLAVQAAATDEIPEPEYVQWVNDEGARLGLVEPQGLLKHAAEVLTENLVKGRDESCHSAF